MKKSIGSFVALVIIFLAGCNSGGTCINNSPAPSPAVSFSITAPAEYPAGVAVTAYLTITNDSATNAINLSYSIPESGQIGNTTGVNITTNGDSVCSSIAAHSSCVFSAFIGANSNPGAFSVTATGNTSAGVLQNSLTSIEQTLGINNAFTAVATASIGLANIPNNFDLPIYIFPKAQTISESSGLTLVWFSMIVNNVSNSFDTLSFYYDGNPIEIESQLSSHVNGTPYVQDEVITVSFLLPASAIGTHALTVVAKNGQSSVCESSSCSDPSVVNVVGKGAGILQITPSVTNMSTSYLTQTYQLLNIGESTISGVNVPASSSLFDIRSNCAENPFTLAANESCTYTVTYLPTYESGSQLFEISYNNGINDTLDYTRYSINYTGLSSSGVITMVADNFVNNESIIQGDSFKITATLTGENVPAQTISVSNLVELNSAGISVISSPTDCVLQTTQPAVESCVFSVKVGWNSTPAGYYKVNFSNNAAGVINESSFSFNAYLPVVYLPQTGESPGLPINALPGYDGYTYYGLPWAYLGGSPTIATPRFIEGDDIESECLTDSLTGLMWSKNANLSNARVTWANAITNSNNLTLCGHSDWRLPNITELASLLNYGYFNGATNNQTEWLMSQGFVNVMSTFGGFYFSSSTDARQPGQQKWAVQMTGGSVNLTSIPSTWYWPVRGGPESQSSIPELVAKLPQTGESVGTTGASPVVGADGNPAYGESWPSPRFVAGIGIESNCITDRLTGLIWARDTAMFPMVNWSDSLEQVAGMNNNILSSGYALCGHTDWRMPNVVEIRSIINYGYGSSTADNLYQWLAMQGFNINIDAIFWSSSSVTTSTASAYVMSSVSGDIIPNDKTTSTSPMTWPVRGGH